MKRRIGIVLMFVLLAGIAGPAQTPQGTQPPLGTPMPDTAIHQPEFVAASEATFLEDDDVLLGITSGNVAKAYPAADLSQHSAVSDKVPDGPISVTWCGVCNTGVVFRAEVKGRTLHFQKGRRTARSPSTSDCRRGKPWPDSKSVVRPWRTRSRSCASRVSSTTAWAD